MRRRRIGWLLLGLVLAALAALGALALRPGAPGPVDGAGVRQAGGAGTAEELPAGEPHAQGPQLAGAGPHAPRPPAARFVLRVRTPPASAGVRFAIQVSGTTRMGSFDDDRDPVPCAASGTTEVDVRALVLRPEVHTLQVSVEGTQHLPASAAIALPETLEERLRGLELVADLAPEPVAVVTGRVVDVARQPLPGAWTVADLPGGAPDSEHRLRSDAQPTDAAGRFRLRVAAAEAAVVLAAHEDLEPSASAPFRASPGRTVDVGDLVLRPGAGLAAHVDCGLADVKIEVRAESLEAGRLASLPGIAWGPAGPLQRGTTWRATSGPSAWRGAGAGLWTLAAHGPDWGCARSHAVLRASRAIVRAGAPPVRLDARTSLLRVVVSGPGGRLHDALVLLTAGETLGFPADASGHGAVVYPPNTEVHARVWHPHHVPAEATLRTGAEGEERTLEVSLVRGASTRPAEMDWFDHAPTSLSLRVLSRDDVPLRARVRVLDADGRRVAVVWREEANFVRWRLEDEVLGLSEAEAATRLPDGVYTVEASVEGHAPASAQVTLGPGADPWRPGPPRVTLQPVPR